MKKWLGRSITLLSNRGVRNVVASETSVPSTKSHVCLATVVIFYKMPQCGWVFIHNCIALKSGLSGPNEPSVSYSKPFHKFLTYLE